MRRWPFRIAALLGATVVVAAAAIIALFALDPRPAVEFYASRALDRRVTASDIRIGWGKPLIVEIANLRVANPSWASEPDMIRVEYLSADIDTDALWRGVMRFNRLRVEKPRLLLERGEGEARNWRFPGGGAPAEGGLAIVPKNRTQFPTLIDFALRNGEIIFRSFQRRDIRIGFHTLTVGTPADDQPMHLAVDGSYNAAPVRMTVDTDSVTRLRDRTVPFGAKVSIGTVPGSIDFTGTLAEPLDFEGVQGTLRIDAQNTGDLLKIFSADLSATFPLRVAGAFDKQGEHWQISTAKGNVAGSDFTGAVALTEGGRGEPDDVVTTLAFNQLFLQPLLGKSSDPNKPHGLEAISLKPEDKPGVTADAKITAAKFIYGSGELDDFALEARSRPGELTIGKLAFAFAGGRIEGSGGTRSVGAAGRAAADVAFAGLDADQLVQLLSGPGGQLTGRVNGRAILEMTGTTAKDGLQQSYGEAVLAMAQGQASRDLVEKASTDLRTLFRKGEGMVQLSCLVGYVELENGRATIAPLRLHTPDTTLIAGGIVDLVNNQIDLTIRSGSTSLFALKAPIRISGSFEKANARPAFGGGSPRLVTHLDAAKLPTKLRQIVDGNPCLE